MFKGLSSKLIAELNKDYDGGTYFEAIVVTRDMDAVPQVKDYFCHFTRPVSFNGNVYYPEPMKWEGSFKMTERMELPSVKINMLNIGRVIDSYINDNSINIRHNDIEQQVLHMDRNGVVSMYDNDIMQIQVIHSGGKGMATIFAGLDMRLTDRVPRETMENTEYPGIRNDVGRSQ